MNAVMIISMRFTCLGGVWVLLGWLQNASARLVDEVAEQLGQRASTADGLARQGVHLLFRELPQIDGQQAVEGDVFFWIIHGGWFVGVGGQRNRCFSGEPQSGS